LWSSGFAFVPFLGGADECCIFGVLLFDATTVNQKSLDGTVFWRSDTTHLFQNSSLREECESARRNNGDISSTETIKGLKQ
jgi:hypothetical protein